MDYKITADGNCSPGIKKCLLLERKAITNLDSVLKSRDVILLTKMCIVKAVLEEAQAGIKIAGRNINNLRYADDTTLMAESEEELKILLMKEESEKS